MEERIIKDVNNLLTQLFQKMHDAGYEWDAKKRELKKIEHSSQWNISDFRTWQHIVSDILTKHQGIGQYLDDGLCRKIAQDMQEEWSKKLCLVQHPAEWSEEDDEHLERILKELERKRQRPINRPYLDKIESDYNWLKNLKDRVLPQPKQEWSEEDEKKLSRIYSILGQVADEHAFCNTCRLIGDKECVELQDWLKTLEDRYCSLPKHEWNENEL